MLPLLNIHTICVLVTAQSSVSNCEDAWISTLDQAIAAAEDLLHQVQLAGASKAKTHQNSVQLHGLAHAVVGAISVLRKRLHHVFISSPAGKQFWTCRTPLHNACVNCCQRSQPAELI